VTSPAHGAVSSSSSSPKAGAGTKHPALDSCGNVEAVDWDRLISERETTAAALSAALQRAKCVEREVQELRQEREDAEKHSHEELRSLRERLRRCMSRPERDGPDYQAKLSETNASMGADSYRRQPSISTRSVSENLFKRRAEDLQHTVAGLKLELRRASSSELALKRSVDARSSAIRSLLRSRALRGLTSVQCGPWRLPPTFEAERRALVVAVEEQLRFNLVLRNSHSGAGGKQAGNQLLTFSWPGTRQSTSRLQAIC